MYLAPILAPISSLGPDFLSQNGMTNAAKSAGYNAVQDALPDASENPLVQTVVDTSYDIQKKVLDSSEDQENNCDGGKPQVRANPDVHLRPLP